MSNQNKLLRYSVYILLFIVIVLFIFLFKKTGNKGQENIIAVKDDIQCEQQVYCKKQVYFEVFNLLIDLAYEIRNYFNAASSFNNINKNTDLDSFVRSKIDSFTSMEFRFEKISKNLKFISGHDKIIKKIAKISSKFGFFSKRYVDLILMVKRDPYSLEPFVTKSRNSAEFGYAWSDLQILVKQFADKYKNCLTPKEKIAIYNKIKHKFKQEVELFITTLNEKGVEVAERLRLNGAWLSLLILLCLDLI